MSSNLTAGSTNLNKVLRLWYTYYMRKCLECSKDTNNPKFCSLSCGAKMQARSRVLKDKTKTCLECGKSFTYAATPKQKFCGHSCSAAQSNRNRAKSKEFKYCIHCGETKVKNKVAKFCSSKCSGAYQTQKIIDDWIDNPSSATTSQGLKSAIKKYLIQQASYACSECGWDTINPATGRCPLEVDHIDGDAYNNSPNNLRVICPNCHSLTSTYRALNRNSSRTYRKN